MSSDAETEAQRDKIVRSLSAQGFLLDDRQRISPGGCAKSVLRNLHAAAVAHKREKAGKSLRRHESRLLTRFASGREVWPEAIAPKLVEVQPGSEEELLFRYAALHWSIPTSAGYGRRLRFLVLDEANGKVMGLLGLGDPVFSLGARDEWIGWDRNTVKRMLRYVMDIYVLGAAPPYSSLLGGKLVGLIAGSDEVRDALARKYSGRKSLISGTASDSRLALLTTASALGRSSLYNRLKLHNRPAFISAGFTKGYGEFHFSNGLYSEISEYAAQHLKPTAKHAAWGGGFRNRREIVGKYLAHTGAPRQWLNHGIRREVFVVPLAENSREFLRGEEPELREFRQPAAEIFSFFRERWLLPRSQRDTSYRDWHPEQWRLWEK